MNLNILIKTLNTLNIKNVRTAIPYLQNYNSFDWRNYIKYRENTYTKNLIHRNSSYELFIIVWDKKIKSKIHDHSNNGCTFKLLEGHLKEDVYCKNLELKQTNKYSLNDISYIDNSLGYHLIENNSNNVSVSLHLYSPPKYKTNYYKQVR